MYQAKMAVAIKVAGKILREHGEEVYLPFGSEYSLVLKNLNNRRACVKLSIDGQEIVDGGLIVGPNQTIDLERFVKAGQFDKGNRLKFIERNEKVEATRGIKVDDGLLRIEFEFEKEQQFWRHPNQHIQNTLFKDRHDSYFNITNDSFRSVGGIAKGVSGMSDSFSATASLSAQNTTGITVPGSVSEQKFTTTNFTGDGFPSVMVIRLLGEVAEAKVIAPVTVKTVLVCSTCGHDNKAPASFCSQCGTGLHIV